MSEQTNPEVEPQRDDPVNHPKHYNSHPSGVEAIEIMRHMTANVAQVFKYCWRAGLKNGSPTSQDLRKAAFYLNDEIERVEGLEEEQRREQIDFSFELKNKEDGTNE